MLVTHSCMLSKTWILDSSFGLHTAALLPGCFGFLSTHSPRRQPGICGLITSHFSPGVQI